MNYKQYILSYLIIASYPLIAMNETVCFDPKYVLPCDVTLAIGKQLYALGSGSCLSIRNLISLQRVCKWWHHLFKNKKIRKIISSYLNSISNSTHPLLKQGIPSIFHYFASNAPGTDGTSLYEVLCFGFNTGINHDDAIARTPLLVAARSVFEQTNDPHHGQISLEKLTKVITLIDAGANVNCCNAHNNSLFHSLVTNIVDGHKPAVEICAYTILKLCGGDDRRKNSENISPTIALDVIDRQGNFHPKLKSLVKMFTHILLSTTYRKFFSLLRSRSRNSLALAHFFAELIPEEPDVTAFFALCDGQS